MKIRLLIPLAGLAISFALPTFAQQTNTPDPQIRQQLDAFVKGEDEAYNNNDAAAIAATFTKDAVQVTPEGPIYGREAIEKYFADLLQKIHFSNHVTKVDPDSPHAIGNEMWATAEWSLTIQSQNGPPIQLHGYWGAVKAREGDTWKTRMGCYNITPAPAATDKTAETK
jgi:uncharacterized protein (TIGR02246 family)